MPEASEDRQLGDSRHGLAVCLGTSAVLFVLGVLLALLLPEPAPPSAELLRSFLSYRGLQGEDGVHPESKEQSIFFALVLAAPLAVVIVSELTRRRRLPRALWVVALLLGALGIVQTASVVLAPLRTVVEVQEPLHLLAIFALGVGAAGLTLSRWASRLGWLGHVAVLSVLAFAVLGLKLHGVERLVDWGPDELHLQSFVFGAAQAAGGKRCLVDYVPLYGCYGDLLAPLLRALGSTLDALSWCMLTANLAGLAALWCFLRSLVQRALLVLLPLGAVTAMWVVKTTRVPIDVVDHYYQYLPLRFVFPALALVLGLAYRGPSRARAAAFGAFGALAVTWNPDSGVAATGSLMAVVGFDLVPYLRRLLGLAQGSRLATQPERRAFSCLLAFVFGFAAWTLASLAVQYVRSGAIPDPTSLFYYSQLYFGVGWFMIPMPREISSYPLVAIVYVALLARALVAAEPQRDRFARACLQLAVLGLGLFLYYVGRSHPAILMIVSWPAVLGCALLLDDAASRSSGLRRESLVHAVLGASLAATLALTALLSYQRLTWQIPDAIRAMPAFAGHVDFIRRTSTPSTPIAVLAMQQGVLLLQSRRAQSLRSPALAELITRQDLESMIAQLASGQVQLAYVDRDLDQVRPFIIGPLRPTLSRHFEPAGRSPDGRLELLRYRR